MGRITAAYADLVVVTDDDPWSEDPAAIRAAVLDGAKAIPGATVLCVPDRAEAIAVAVENARAGDTLLIAGRGHEIEQSYSDKAVAFDDRVVLGERIDAWMAARDAA
jgi:UDP-N-acetylmuramoyl-L-alanyl-D-glutamate--2,6-diaminopimelate ligase